MNTKEASCLGKAVTLLEFIVKSKYSGYILNPEQRTMVKEIVAEAKEILSESDK